MEAYRRALTSGTGYCCSASSFAAGVCQKKAAGAGRAVGTGGDRPRIYSPIVWSADHEARRPLVGKKEKEHLFLPFILFYFIFWQIHFQVNRLIGDENDVVIVRGSWHQIIVIGIHSKIKCKLICRMKIVWKVAKDVSIILIFSEGKLITLPKNMISGMME
jgi:hypothetical protein